MKVSYNWLKSHVPLGLSVSELSESLLKLGFEVADARSLGAGFEGVVSGEILSIAKHPQADRLSLCSVTDGQATFSVVCGAKNIAVGQKIPLARLGARLPGGIKITRAKIRGVESEGMICSAAELGLDLVEGNGGIMVLPPETALGKDLAAGLAQPDDVLEVEITPNRPDCLSHRGLARELAAFLRLPLQAPAYPGATPGAGPVNLPIEVREPEACPRYAGRFFSGLEIKPSPAWLAQRLEAVGLRPINNLVDITNFILLDLGQPMHAFDAAALAGERVVVRFAKAGERLQALDEKTYELTPECLVIADKDKPQAIAGVMGGKPSGVSTKTTTAFLESAYFSPAAVRRASKLLDLSSDSSYRFERGTDPRAPAEAAELASRLIAALCGGKVAASPISDAYPKPGKARVIAVSAKRINAILGSSYPERDVEAALKSVSASLTAKNEELLFTAPSYRGDLALPEDLAEETARLLGFDAIPARLAPGGSKPENAAPDQVLREAARDRLKALGFSEAYNYDFISDKALAQAGIAEVPGRAFVRLARPLNEDWACLRPSLIPGLLSNARLNLNRGQAGARLFEIGRVYARTDQGVQERTMAAGVLFGPRARWHWQTRDASRRDFFDAKGVMEDLTAGWTGLAWSARAAGSLALRSDDSSIGWVGYLSPAVARAWDISEEKPCVFELDLDALAKLKPEAARFKAASPFPGSQRDLSFFVDRKVSYAQLRGAVLALRLAPLQDLDVFDVYMGRGVPEGQKSVTLRLSFALPDRTLKDAEVNEAVERICGELKARFAILWRS